MLSDVTDEAWRKSETASKDGTEFADEPTQNVEVKAAPDEDLAYEFVPRRKFTTVKHLTSA
jgi:hypothetical protein